jgi:protein-tyrosine phosphatase
MASSSSLLSLRAYMIEAHEIVPGLWQGSRPPTGRTVASAGFDVAVFCALEYQPPGSYFPGVQVIHAPNDDDPLFPISKQDLQTAVVTASRLADLLAKDRKILVTCMAGINRSGLVVALTLHKVFGYSGHTCIELVRERRTLDDGEALRNRQFVDALMKLAGRDGETPEGTSILVP